MNSKHRKILEAIFADPVRADIAWQDIESLFKAQGGIVREGRGSRVRFIMGKEKDAMDGENATEVEYPMVATFHRPHPQPYTDKGAVKSVRRFFEAIGVKP